MAEENKIEQIMKTIENMTVLEMSDLVKALEDKFGVSANIGTFAPVGAAVQAAAPGVVTEEKSTFDVILVNSGDKKIQVIKEIRAITSLGLKEAKDLVDQAPKSVKTGVNKEEAEEIKKKLEAQGAKVELK